jgi:hypothetical protein
MNKKEKGDSAFCKDRGCAVQAEQDITKYFRRHKILCEDQVLDVYHSATIKSYEDPVMETSMFDFIFPSSKSPPSSETRAKKQNDEHEHHAQQKNK